MPHFKKFTSIIAVFILSAWLTGCAATRPVSTPAEPREPAPEPLISQPVATPAEPKQPAPEPLISLPETAQPPAEIRDDMEQEMEESQMGSSQTSISRQTEYSGPEEIKVNFADIEFVLHRLIVYENKLEQWLEILEIAPEGPLTDEIISLEAVCLQRLESILKGYSELMERMQHDKVFSLGTAPAASPKAMQQHDIAFLESRCNELLVMDFNDLYEPMPGAEPELSFAEAQEVIATHVTQGNYQEALSAFEGLSTEFPDLEPSIATRLNYGRALQYTGQVDAAAQYYKSMLESGDLDIEPLAIQRQVADFLLADADVAAAEFYYNSMIRKHQALSFEKIWAQEQLAFLDSVDPKSEDMIAYMKLLREFQTYDYKMHAPRLNEMADDFARAHAGSPVAVSVLRLRTFAADQLKSWFGRQLVRIDTLVAEKRFTAASDMLKNISRYYLPPELQAVLQKTFYDVAQTEIQEQQTQQRIEEMELTEQWDSAVDLLDSRQYDNAISAFQSFTGTEYEERARMKIVEAANRAAGTIRKEAASLFIRAGKTADLEQKKNLLLDSHRLLTEILTRYPQTELLDKVQQNISVLEEQIERLDPTLLEELRQRNPDENTAGPNSPEL